MEIETASENKYKSLSSRITEWTFIVLIVIACVKLVFLCTSLATNPDLAVQHLVELTILFIAAYLFRAISYLLEYVQNDHRPRWLVYQQTLEATEKELVSYRLDLYMTKIRQGNLLFENSDLKKKLKSVQMILASKQNEFSTNERLLSEAQRSISAKTEEINNLFQKNKELSVIVQSQQNIIAAKNSEIESLRHPKRASLINM